MPQPERTATETETDPLPPFIAATPKGPVSMRLGELDLPVAERRQDHESVQTVIRRDLTRYYKLLEDAAREMTLTLDEANTLVYLIDSRFDRAAYRYLWAELSTALETERKAETEPESYSFVPSGVLHSSALVEKVRALSAGGCMSLLDRIERYHATADDNSFAPISPDINAMERVGLINQHFAEQARKQERDAAAARRAEAAKRAADEASAAAAPPDADGPRDATVEIAEPLARRMRRRENGRS